MIVNVMAIVISKRLEHDFGPVAALGRSPIGFSVAGLPGLEPVFIVRI